MWFKGPEASIAIRFDDDSRTVTARTDSPIVSDVGNGIVIQVWSPGQEFFPVTSSSGDHFAVIVINGHAATGHIVLQGLRTEPGRFDIYSDFDAITSFRDHLVRGRLVDLASTTSAIVVGAYVSAKTWIDIDGKPQQMRNDVPGKLWGGSAGGPTRAGQQGIDLTTPGENLFATIATNSYWATFRWNLIQGGGGYYSRQGAVSGATPIAVGALALMLQMKPDLTSEEARSILHKTATSDANTGTTPNLDWGFGKINVRKTLDEMCVQHHSQMCGDGNKSKGSKTKW